MVYLWVVQVRMRRWEYVETNHHRFDLETGTMQVYGFWQGKESGLGRANRLIILLKKKFEFALVDKVDTNKATLTITSKEWCFAKTNFHKGYYVWHSRSVSGLLRVSQPTLATQFGTGARQAHMKVSRISVFWQTKNERQAGEPDSCTDLREWGRREVQKFGVHFYF